MHAPMKLHRYQGSRNSHHLGVGEMAWLGRYFVPKHENEERTKTRAHTQKSRDQVDCAL